MFARKLMTARVAAGYRSARRFARATGFKYETYRQWEAGDTIPRYDTLLTLCKLLNVTPNDLLLGDQEDTVLTAGK